MDLDFQFQVTSLATVKRYLFIFSFVYLFIFTSWAIDFEAVHQFVRHRGVHRKDPGQDGYTVTDTGEKALMTVGRNEVCLRVSIYVHYLRYNHQTKPFPDVPVQADANVNFCFVYKLDYAVTLICILFWKAQYNVGLI